MSDVTYGFLWGAVAVVVIWFAFKFLFRGSGETPLSVKTVITGKDNRMSLSKLQGFVWFIAIFFAYVATFSVRARYGDVSALGDIPENLMYLLAFSAGGAVGSKWLTIYQIRGKTVTKTDGTRPAMRDLVADDSGYSAWNKLQLFFFTVLALVIFLFGVRSELRMAGADSPPGLPNIDSTLLVLMGISQGAYLGKKAVTTQPAGQG